MRNKQLISMNIFLPTYNRPSWGGRKAVAGEHKMGTGDISRAMIENTKETAIDVEVINAQHILYLPDG